MEPPGGIAGLESILQHNFVTYDTAQITLVPIDAAGRPADPGLYLNDFARDVCLTTALMYRRGRYQPPWIGYLAVLDGNVLGACAFLEPPREGRVEIAYLTFPAFEHRGFGTAMAARLVALARATDPSVVVYAHTLALPHASNAILGRLGFSFAGAVPDPEEGTLWEFQLRAA